MAEEAVMEQAKTEDPKGYTNKHLDAAIKTAEKKVSDNEGISSNKHLQSTKPKEDSKSPVDDEEQPKEAAHDEEEEESPDDRLKRIQDKTQKRIDKIIAEKKSLEERLKAIEEQTKEDDDTELTSLKSEHADILNKLDDVDDHIEEARLDGDKDVLKKLRREKRRLEANLREVEDDYKSTLKAREKKTVDVQKAKNANQWQESWTEVFEEFPELQDANGRLKGDHELVQKMFELFGDSPTKGSFYNWTDDNFINSRYDNPNGPLMAAHKAAKIIGYSIPKSKVETIKNQKKTTDAKNQMIGSSNGSGELAEGRVTRAKLDKLEAEAFGPGVRANDPRRLNYLRALREFERR